MKPKHSQPVTEEQSVSADDQAEASEQADILQCLHFGLTGLRV